MASRFTITVLVAFSASAWALFLLATGGSVGVSFFKPATFIISVLSTGFLAFDKWAWRWRGINRLHNRPNLGGTWVGTLASNYIPEGQNASTPPSEVALIIHQSYSRLHLRLLTTESASTSLTTELQALPDGRYTATSLYRNEPGIAVRARSPIHYGALRLDLQGKDLTQLVGDYWTDRGIQGELNLSRVARIEATDYQAAIQLSREDAPLT